ncbi:U6 small nuclear RNA (adenine-(43)-N(6))-methyltransferase [Nymphon striatum]|nr:U6 small nuclear RNA (adenine-(43)-N(6))-methyltransferase [Nymphon striatum]
MFAYRTTVNGTTGVSPAEILQGLKFSSPIVMVASCTVTTFCQGNTMRWGIAWTFNENLKLDQLQVSTHKKKTKTPKPPLIHQIYHDDTIKELLQKILAIIAKLEMHYKILKKSSTFMLLKVFAEKNTWSHQRRKRREKRKREDVDTKIPEEQVKNASRSIDEEKHKHKLSDIESGSSSLPDERIKLDDAISV